MQLTRYTDYAFRTLIYLSALAPDERAQVGHICECYDLSANHLAKVVQRLARLGYVQTRRGRGGGISLAKDPAQINVGDVVRAMEPTLNAVNCDEPRCTLAGNCRLTGILAKAMQAFLAILDDYSLADLERSEWRTLLLIDDMAISAEGTATR